MIKKGSIVIICLFVIVLSISHHHAQVRQRAESLIAHAYYGDLLSVKEDVEQGAPLDFALYFSDAEREYTHIEFNALHAAASSGNEDVINFLLDQGMNIDATTPDGWTPLFIAARDGNAETAKLLVFRGANLNQLTNLGASALLMAVTQPYPTEKERLELVSYLLKRGADPNLSAQNTAPTLYYASLLQNVPLVELLLEHQASLSTQLLQNVQEQLKDKPGKETQKITALLTQKAVNTH